MSNIQYHSKLEMHPEIKFGPQLENHISDAIVNMICYDKDLEMLVEYLRLLGEYYKPRFIQEAMERALRKDIIDLVTPYLREQKINDILK